MPSTGTAYRDALVLARDTFGVLMLPPVRRSVAVTEVHATREPVTARARWKPVAGDYRAVVDALAARGALPTTAVVRT